MIIGFLSLLSGEFLFSQSTSRSLESAHFKALQEQHENRDGKQKYFLKTHSYFSDSIPVWSKSHHKYLSKNYEMHSFFGIRNSWIGKKVMSDNISPTWLRSQKQLARIFHPSLLRRKPGTPIATALDLNFDQDSMDSYSPDKNPSSALPYQPSRLSRRESDEISGLEKKVFPTTVCSLPSGRLMRREFSTYSYPTKIFYPEAKAQGSLDHDLQQAIQQKKSPEEVRKMLEKEF